MIAPLPFFAASLAAAAVSPVTVPPQPALAEQIARADAELFDLFFVQPCDEPRFRRLIADDVEFYHDKDGFVAKSAADFLAAYRKNCASRSDPTAWRSRRELVASSLRVDPVPGWGAMETGDHLFYERHGATGAESLAGKASFSMVWVLGADGQWRVSRVLSYAHRPAK
jgi:hypothetical protein